jgi:TolA-binding protein
VNFEKFIKEAKNNKELVADAYNRIADCYFYQRDYANADKHYKLASSKSNDEADYALFRSALTQGLSKDYGSKVSTLQQLIERFPNSTYIEQAYHEMARSYIEQEKFDEAVAAYDNLIEHYPNGELARRAANGERIKL